MIEGPDVYTKMTAPERPVVKPRQLLEVFQNGADSLGVQLSLEFSEFLEKEVQQFIGGMNDARARSVITCRLEQMAREWLSNR